ncbi:hypothetical protein KABACHOK_02160 [Brevundimonas phage vB_BpoS-Kabachok]|uniref:Uncharacterized protein n=1 Tax=Brevundimonas phage vB_BpoS-Kabachok TaxID=2948600 RepID=A0A9E7SLR5_9CAUD|nr:hypothetical protein KABACHOK_02160 [Brevundimonas phage vB_BpoS-Kabachok]
MAPEDVRLHRLVDTANALSDEAAHICAQDYFSAILMNKPILLAPQNKRQARIFEELLEHGLVHGDVERGVYGFRSTYDGRAVAALCRRAMAPRTEGDDVD